MQLSNEIQEAAKELGNLLRSEVSVKEYLRLLEEIKQNPEVTALEEQYSRLYQVLVERQQNGEFLSKPELDEHYRLKQQFEDHPLINARDVQMEWVKAKYVQVAQRLTSMLGIDFPAFVR